MLTLVGVLVGFILIPIIKPLNPSDDVVMWIGLPGELFMRGLYCMVIPVLTASVITATASVDPKTNGKMSGYSIVYMVTMVFFGVVVGTVLTISIKPGRIAIGNDDDDFTAAHYETQDVIADLLRNLIPDNLVKACIKTVYTDYVFEEIPTDNQTNMTGNSTYSVELTTTSDGGNSTTSTSSPASQPEFRVESKSLAYGDGTNLLGLLVFSAVFGITMCFERALTLPMYNFMVALRLISIRILSAYIWLLPIGTASLICKSMLKVDNIIAVWKSLGLFSADVIVGLGIHGLITLPLTYFIVTRKNPYLYMLRSLRAIVMASITKTNTANMPEIFQCCIVNNKVNKKVVNYVVSMMVAMKSDGSAVFIISGSLYLAQTSGMALNAGHIITMAIVAWVMGLCLPAVPSASLVSIVTVCSSVGVPTDNIGLLVSMEWLLDALRTSVNCISHCQAAGLVESLLGDDVTNEPIKNEEDVTNKNKTIKNGANDQTHSNEELSTFI
uniref:Amino acid transporter n=1 Tax=Saccoglossus kowalevskii TaxID=10224 RepID=A0ABM0GQ00_SACKO|nr:PREDICTED: excitatory amino acid transporter 1-like [Saccoglossus kowalevskii]